MAPLKPRGIFNGKKWEGELPSKQTFHEFKKECEALDARTIRQYKKTDLAWTLPRGASKTLQDAYFEAKKYPEDSLKRAQIIDQAIRKVRRDYRSEFRFDPNYSGCK